MQGLARQTTIEWLAAEGKRCHEAGKTKPTECYIYTYGSINGAKEE